jgi:hypothetical protein
MASPVRLYQTEIHTNLGFFPTWLPGDKIEIGDIGVLSGGQFRKMASLIELGIPFEVNKGTARQYVQYTSSQGTKLTTTASGATAGLATSEIAIEFSKEGAFVFHASRLQALEMANRVAVSDALLKVHMNGKWNTDWLLVDTVHSSECATIIIAQESSAMLILGISAEHPIASVLLADPSVSLSVKSTRGKITHIIGDKNLHPLYSCLRIKERVFGSTRVEPVLGAIPQTGELELSRPGIDDLLNS